MQIVKWLTWTGSDAAFMLFTELVPYMKTTCETVSFLQFVGFWTVFYHIISELTSLVRVSSFMNPKGNFFLNSINVVVTESKLIFLFFILSF